MRWYELVLAGVGALTLASAAALGLLAWLTRGRPVRWEEEELEALALERRAQRNGQVLHWPGPGGRARVYR